MYKAYKFRLYPNDQQKEKLNKTFGCNRFVYNYYLRKIISEEYINAYSCIKDYTNKLKYVSRFTFAKVFNSTFSLSVTTSSVVFI